MAFNAENDLEVEQAVDDEAFQNDLALIESNGRPLWDGATEIQNWQAEEEERDKFDSSRAKAILETRLQKGILGWVADFAPATTKGAHCHH